MKLSEFRFIAITARAIAVSEEAQAIRPYEWREKGIKSFNDDLERARSSCDPKGYQRAVAYGIRKC